MSSSMLLCMFFIISSNLILSWKHVFIVLLFIDLWGLLVVLSSSELGVNSLVLLLVLQVYSSTLGVSLLVWTLRSLGSDKIRILF